MDGTPTSAPAHGQKVHLPSVAGAGGVVWSVSPDGFHANLVVLDAGGAVDAHRNDELDVLVVVLDGAGSITVDGGLGDVGPGDAVLVPRGSVRAIRAGPAGVRYLTIHATRRPLRIGPRGGDDV